MKLVSENLKDNFDIDITWESVGDIKTSVKEYSTYCKWKQYELLLDEGCVKLLD